MEQSVRLGVPRWRSGPGVFTYGSAGDGHLDLAAGRGHQLGELLGDALEDAQTVVVGQGGEEVLDGRVGGARLLLELGDDGRLVGGSQGRGAEDAGQLGVLADEVVECIQGLGGGLQGRRLGGRRVLDLMAHVLAASFPGPGGGKGRIRCSVREGLLLYDPIGGCYGSSGDGSAHTGAWEEVVTPYQGRGVGAVEAVDGDRRLDILGRGRGVAARRDAGKGSLGSCGAGGAECWSGEHGDVTMGGRQLVGGGVEGRCRRLELGFLPIAK